MEKINLKRKKNSKNEHKSFVNEQSAAQQKWLSTSGKRWQRHAEREDRSKKKK